MRNVFWGFLLVVMGMLFLLDNLNVLSFGEVIGDFWPLIFVIWGLSILLRRRRSHPDTPLESFSASPADLVHESNVFGDISLSVRSQNFKGGSLSTIFGDIDLDLSSMSVAEGEHILRIHSVFGDSFIVTSKDTAIAVSTNTLFGSITLPGQRKEGFSPSVNTATENFSSGANRLRITVSKIFGNIRMT